MLHFSKFTIYVLIWDREIGGDTMKQYITLSVEKDLIKKEKLLPQ